MVTAVWKSAAVLKVWVCFTGMVVFRSMIFVWTPPRVSTPRERGVTSSRTMSEISPARIAPWMEAPMATHSMGSMPLSGFFPTMPSTNCWTIGIFVWPPKRMTLSICWGVSFASLMVWRIGCRIFSTMGLVSCSSFARVRVRWRFFGPLASMAM